MILLKNMKRLWFFIIVFCLLSFSAFSEVDKKLSKKDIILTSVTILNPALSVGTILSNANTLQKILSFGNLVYTTKEGKTITESAFSQGKKNKCFFKKIFSKKEFCL